MIDDRVGRRAGARRGLQTRARVHVPRWIGWWAAILVAVSCWAVPKDALATSFTVNAPADAPDLSPGDGLCDDSINPGSQCSLRAAIQELNAQGGGPHTITLPAGTYTLVRTGSDDTALNGDLDVTASIIITGAGANTTIIQACDAGADPNCSGIDRIFDVLPGASLALSGVTIRKGRAVSTGNGIGGGGIQTRGTLALANTILDRNQSDFGGGLSVQDSTASAVLTNVSVTNNSAQSGGAGIHNEDGVLTLTNVTISGNHSANVTAGLYQRGFGSPSAILANVTVADNTSGESGAGILLDSGTVTLRNSIIANNRGIGAFPDRQNCASFGGTFTSQGFNLIFPSDSATSFPFNCSFRTTKNDLIGQDPKLGPLQNNGGPIPTHALLPDSAAIDAGNPAAPGSSGASCPPADARGQARPADGDLDGSARCDIGAYELVPFAVNSTADADDAGPGDGTCQTSTAGQCTLRAAIREANAAGGGVISLPNGLYTLTRSGADDTAVNGDLDVTGDVAIVGARASSTVVQACNELLTPPTCTGIDRVFDVQPSGRLTLVRVAVRNGGTSGRGAGIHVRGAAILTDVALDNNRSTGAAGGGLSVDGNAATASLTNVSITNNRATSGGGIDNFGGVLTLTNVTLSGNAGTSASGGGLTQSGSGTPGATLTNVTVADNDAPGGGGGLRVDAGTITLSNSIVASNTDSTTDASANCLVTATGAFASQGFNLVFPGNGCGFSAGTNDRLNQDSRLGPIAFNGAQTRTRAPLAGSAAIDAGNPATPLDSQGGRCAATDQRGQARVDGNLDGTVRCDIGALEFKPVTADLSVTLTDGAATAPAGGTVTYTLTVTNPSTSLIPRVPVAATFSAPLTDVSWACISGSTSCAPASGTGNMRANVDLAPGASAAFSIRATVPPGTPAGTTFTATGNITLPVGIDDPTSTNDNVTDTDTVVPSGCAPRPPVLVTVTPSGAGRLLVVLEAGRPPVQTDNAIRSVRLGTLQNAAVDVPNQPGVAPAQNGLGNDAQVAMLGPAQRIQLLVRRQATGAFTVPLTVTDDCGAWPTFAGGGTAVP